MNGSDGRTVVVAGASGVVGTALIRALGSFNLIGLVHKRSPADASVDTVGCDVTESRLGLSETDFRELAARTDAIVHAAGLTDFGAEEERHRTINTEGTRHMLELASAADAPLHYISTSYTRAISDAAMRKLDPSNTLYNYVSSKQAAERLIVESGVPYVIYRPSNLIGDSTTGEMPLKEFVPQLAVGLLRGRYPVVPARPGARLDIVPQDVCARAVAAVLEAGDVGDEHWLTYGDESPTIVELVDVCTDFARRIGSPIERPTIFDPDDPEQIADALQRLPVVVRSVFKRMILGRLLDLNDGMTAIGVFPSSLGALGERYGLRVPPLADALQRGLEFAAKAKRLGPGRRSRLRPRRS